MEKNLMISTAEFETTSFFLMPSTLYYDLAIKKKW